MKTLLMTFNAKYIHTSLALRLLKVNTHYPCDLLEFTIKESINEVIEQVKDYDLIALSVYIWNVEKTQAFVQELKKRKPHIRICLGGPEVTYDVSKHLAYADYVIKGEGEVAFDALLHALINQTPLSSVPHLSTQEVDNPFYELDLTTIHLPYDEPNDHKNRITYIETSRGCPYLCTYCMASLEKKVRYFDIEVIKKAIKALIQKGARQFKFLDRTFNTDVKRTLDFFAFLYDLPEPNLSFQFEITGDLLKPEIIHNINTFAPPNRIRFEIGIQSTNYETNLLVRRIQNNDRLFQNIRQIQAGNKIDLHLDLIAGLPKEDLTSFKKTFNDVIALRPKELQLGFLKCLKGTQLAQDALIYGYVFDENAPYEILHNAVLSHSDISTIKAVEYVLNVFYNKGFFPTLIHALLDKYPSPFDLFLAIYEAHAKKERYQLKDLAITLDTFLQGKHETLRFELLLDYLTYHDCKPSLYLPALSKCSRNALLRQWHAHELSAYRIDDLYKYSVVVSLGNAHVCAIYQPNQKNLFKMH